MLGARAAPKKRDPLQQRIPTNPKYAHVKSTLDTGSSMSKMADKMKDSHKPKTDEYFKRIKGSQLLELIEDEDVEEETVYGLVSQQEVSSEVGPCVVHGSAAAEMDEALYLLLDLRDENDYEDCHIATAICYPHTQLTHSTNYFSSEIYRYKNRPDRMIIIYDDDERLSAPAGKLFVERGVENVYVLTGGLRKFSEKHEDFLTGTPKEYEPSVPGSSHGRPPKTGRTNRSTRPPMTGRSDRSHASVASHSSMRSHGAPSLSMR